MKCKNCNKPLNNPRAKFCSDRCRMAYSRKERETNEVMLPISERGYIYLIKCDEYYKIGTTKRDFQERIAILQVANPHKLRIVFCAKIDEYQSIETSIHEQFEKN